MCQKMFSFSGLRRPKAAKNWQTECLPNRQLPPWKILQAMKRKSAYPLCPSVDIRGSLKMFPKSLNFLRNTKQHNHWSYISFKTVPLYNYTLQTATVKMFETFLEAILWKHFQLFRRILNASSIKKRRHFDADFSWGSRWGEYEMMLQCCHIVFC